eukprot:CAMPEP_0184864826 /NCGR_PEP_ID=MMETSP0580-20130426/16111_1 /TAXON_ID=1118495 /ORGANISM="Dactyliosolen fragilissimus" /LENGTH=547 /DNA_ID=CAMNT_0027363747 /DNA_START=194 /DNA_END=1837 /DNA_ORIENTATION=-
MTTLRSSSPRVVPIRKIFGSTPSSCSVVNKTISNTRIKTKNVIHFPTTTRFFHHPNQQQYGRWYHPSISLATSWTSLYSSSSLSSLPKIRKNNFLPNDKRTFTSNDTTIKSPFAGSVPKFVDSSELRKSDHAHAVDLVRARDFEGYLCGLLMPSNARESYFAIRAFNVEIASIKDGGGVVKRRSHSPNSSGSSLALQLRMQWWKDALEDIYDKTSRSPSPTYSPSSSKVEVTSTTNHKNNNNNHNNDDTTLSSSLFTSNQYRNPILRSLSRAISEHQLTKPFLRRMIDAREADLHFHEDTNTTTTTTTHSNLATLRDLLRYAEDTSSSVLYLSLETCNVRNDDADEVAFHLGVAIGLVTTLRSIPFRSIKLGEVAIPLELMTKYNIPYSFLQNPPPPTLDSSHKNYSTSNSNNSDMEDNLYWKQAMENLSPQDQEASRALQQAVKELAQMARTHLHHARSLQGKVPKEGRTALLPSVWALHALQKLESIDYNVFHIDWMGGVEGSGASASDEEDSSYGGASGEDLSMRMHRLRGMLLLMRAWITGVF